MNIIKNRLWSRQYTQQMSHSGAVTRPSSPKRHAPSTSVNSPITELPQSTLTDWLRRTEVEIIGAYTPHEPTGSSPTVALH
jgi:hypothetical protein